MSSAGAGVVSIYIPGATSPSRTLTGLFFPTSLVFDTAGNLYVVNGNTTVSKFDLGNTAPGYTINDGNGGNNYTVTTVAITTGVINQAPLTITATTNTKTYDSTTTAAAIPTVSGLFGADSVTGLAEAYSTSKAGSGKTLSVVTNYTVVDGSGGKNYTVTTVANTTGVISQAPLTITATTNTKTYDSTITAAALPTVAGLVGNDTVTGLSELYDTANAGSGKTLSVNTIPQISATLTGVTAPHALAFDAGGNLFVTNANGTVSKFTPGATASSATLTGLNGPDALAFDGSGNLFVANGNGTVSEFAPGATTLPQRSPG